MPKRKIVLYRVAFISSLLIAVQANFGHKADRMFVKRRKVANFNNNDMLDNNNFPVFNHKILTKFCLEHKNNCDGCSEQVGNRVI